MLHNGSQDTLRKINYPVYSEICNPIEFRTCISMFFYINSPPLAVGKSRLTQQHLDDIELDSGDHSLVFKLMGILGTLLHVALSGQ